MIIATRRLVSRDGGKHVEIPIHIHAPERFSSEWRCSFEIEWPDGHVKRWGAGSDAVQALIIALQMIGSEIYTSRLHESGRLIWLAPNDGYGFPVANIVRDLLVGDDKKFL